MEANSLDRKSEDRALRDGAVLVVREHTTSKQNVHSDGLDSKAEQTSDTSTLKHAVC